MVTSREKEFLAWAAGAYAEKTGVHPQINWARDTLATKKALKWADEGYEEEGFDQLKAAYHNFLADPYWEQRKFPLLSFLAEPHKYVVVKKAPNVPAIPEIKHVVRESRRLSDEEMAKMIGVNPKAYIKALRIGSPYAKTLEKLNPELFHRAKEYLKANYQALIRETPAAEMEIK